MSRRLLLGLDAGSGSGRALLLDPEAGVVASARRPWRQKPVPGSAGLGSDLDLDACWARLADASREALARADAAPDEVVGVAASGVRFGLVVIGSGARVLHAGSNHDGRATGHAFALAQERGAELHARTGHWPMPVSAVARLCWLAAEEPALLERARAALSVSDWLSWRLCGEVVTEPTQATTTGLYDLARGAWAEDLAEALGLPASLLPRVERSGTAVGALVPEAAEAFGLRAGCPVGLGGADTQCALLGAGAVAPGDAGLVAGTTGPVQVVIDRPRVDAEGRLWTERHLGDRRWVLESNAGPLGETIDWTAGLLFADAPDPARRLFAEAAHSTPGAAGMLAAVSPALMDARAMGAPVGGFSFSPMVAADDPQRGRHLARAAVEGAVYALRANLEQAREAAETEPGRVCAAGGLTRSEPWLRILADALGVPVSVSGTPEATALGAALAAGVAAGVWEDPAAAARDAAPTRTVEPDAANHETYERVYGAWRRALAARAPADAVANEMLLPELLRARSASAGAGAAAGHRPRMLVTADLDETSLAELRGLGEVEHASYREAMRLLAGPALVEALAGVEVFATEVDVVDATSLAKLPALRVVATCRGDAVNVDLEACTAYGIPVLHTPGRNADAVADLTLACTLALLRKLPEANAFLRQPGIEPGDMGKMGQAFGALRGRELWQKTVGLIGLGAVGSGVARRLRGFGARVLVHDPFVTREQVARVDAEWVELDALLAESDVVSLHAPVSDATRGLIGARELAAMKPGALLINTARAALVDEDALVASLQRGHLGGAAVDVFAVEPPGSEHPLLRLENVLATPHVGGNTEEVAAHQGRILAAELRRLLAGERPHHALNPETLDGFDWVRPRPEPPPAVLAALADRPPPAVSDLQRDVRPEAAATEAPAAPVAAPREVVDAMERILRRFVEGCVADGDLGAFAADKDVTLHFTLPDVGHAFWLRLRGGMSGDLGAPDERAEVQLKLRADVLDGMFTGRVNAMQAAMNGRLSFTGDAAKAMTLQQIQPDLARCYDAARDAVGDPGDLAALPEPGGDATVSASPGDADVRHEMVRVIHELYAQEVITATGGNVSARVPGEDALWITPSQLFKGDLRPEVLVRIGLDGEPLDEGARSPSSERLVHTAIYRARPEAQAVIHAHAPNATILANTGLPFLPISTEAAFFGEIPRVPFVMPGTDELARAVGEAARECWAVLMVNHGLIVAGRSLRRAADMVEIVERSAEVILGCYAVGREPPTLPDEVVAELRKMGDLVA